MKLFGLGGKGKVSGLKFAIVVATVILAVYFLGLKVYEGFKQQEGFAGTVQKYYTRSGTGESMEVMVSELTARGKNLANITFEKWDAATRKYVPFSGTVTRGRTTVTTIDAPTATSVKFQGGSGRNIRLSGATLGQGEKNMPVPLNDGIFGNPGKITIMGLNDANFNTLASSGDSANKNAVLRVNFVITD